MHFRLRRSIGVLKHEKSTDADAYFLLILILYPTKKNTFSPKKKYFHLMGRVYEWNRTMSVRPSVITSKMIIISARRIHTLL